MDVTTLKYIKHAFRVKDVFLHPILEAGCLSPSKQRARTAFARNGDVFSIYFR